MSTIVALSTSPSVSAIAVIRLSGEKALALVKEIFSGFGGEIKPRYMHYGKIEAEKIKDDCMCVYFPAPHSYTGEDMVEINCHGSTVIVRGLIEYFLSHGAVMAEKGEFTKRAFLNGKLDLTECEGVIDLINSQTEAQSRSAYLQLTGKLHGRIEEIQKKIVTCIAKIEVSLDYPEEEIEEQSKQDAEKEINEIKADIERMIKSYDDGRLIKDGVKIAIVGKPNVGKSALLNALLGYERAIVTDIEGTTRDTLSESFEYKGMKFVITDTAGIRETGDKVEKIGVSLALSEAKSCDVLLLVAECGGEFEKVESSAKILRVENKIDKKEPKYADSVKVSALTGTGIDELKEEIYKATCKDLSIGGGAINNLRHLSAAKEALGYIEEALKSLEFTLDLVSSDLNNAYRALGKITGVVSSDVIVGEIFEKFCVGK